MHYRRNHNGAVAVALGAAPQSVFSTIVDGAKSFAGDMMRSAVRSYRQRQAIGELASLNDRALKDIGVSRCEIHALVYGPDRSRRSQHAGY